MKKDNLKIKSNNANVLLCLVFFCLLGCEPESNKARCVVTGKRYMPAESGDGATFENEKNLIYIKRLNGKPFLFGATETILDVDRESYLKLKIGDTLAKKH